MLGGKLKTDIGFIYIICVYRLHKSNDETFCQELEDLTESLDNPCLIFGDFNYNCFAYNNVEINNHDNIAVSTITRAMDSQYKSLGIFVDFSSSGLYRTRKLKF